MEYLIGLIAALGGAVLYFYNKSIKNKADAIQGEAIGKDKVLKEEQDEVKKAIGDLDKGIEKLREERDKEVKEDISLEERADRWNND